MSQREDVRLPPPWTRYAIAFIVSGSVTVGLMALPWTVPKPGFLLLNLLAVMISAFVSGFGPGLLAMAIGLLGSTYFLMPPVHSLHVTARSDIVGLGIFASAAFLAVWFLDWVNGAA
jgi:two-component system, sensor histidine kinase and response regulator